MEHILPLALYVFVLKEKGEKQMIYIVRHGQTDWNLEGRYAGRKDVELNAKGIEQAESIQKELKNVKFDKVISSPLKRAYKTATIITNSEITVDERIIERCNGKLEGKLKGECPQNIDFNDPNIGLGIESIIDFRGRIFNFFDEITEKYKNQNVLVVTHAGVGIYARCYFEGEPEDGNYSSYKIKNCQVVKYDNRIIGN